MSDAFQTISGLLGGLAVFIFGMNIKRKVCILSSKSDEIVEYILHELHSGASLYDAVGAYDRTTRRAIIHPRG